MPRSMPRSMRSMRLATVAIAGNRQQLPTVARADGSAVPFGALLGTDAPASMLALVEAAGVWQRLRGRDVARGVGGRARARTLLRGYAAATHRHLRRQESPRAYRGGVARAGCGG